MGKRPPLRRPRACRSPTGAAPAAPAAAAAGESRPAIRSPSPARRRFDGGKILRSAADVVGSARGLRVGGECRRPCERQREREGEHGFAHRFLLEFAAMCPACSARDERILPGRLVWSTPCGRPSLGATRRLWICVAITGSAGEGQARAGGKERSPGRGRYGALVQK